MMLTRFVLRAMLGFGFVIQHSVAVADPFPFEFTEDFENTSDFPTTWLVPEDPVTIEVGGYGEGSYWAHAETDGEGMAGILLRDPGSLSWQIQHFEFTFHFALHGYQYQWAAFHLQSNTDWRPGFGPTDGYKLTAKLAQNVLELVRWEGGYPVELIDDAAWIFEVGVPYRIVIEVHGASQDMDVYVDETLVLSGNDATFTQGTISLSCRGGGGESVDTYFDNIHAMGDVPTPTKTTSWGHIRGLFHR